MAPMNGKGSYGGKKTMKKKPMSKTGGKKKAGSKRGKRAY